jgi:hypothetical protein
MPRGVYKREPKAAKTEAAAQPHRVWLQIPEDGMEVKLMSRRVNVLGTLTVTLTGMTWMPNHSKKKPEREITWKIVKRLMELGLVL